MLIKSGILCLFWGLSGYAVAMELTVWRHETGDAEMKASDESFDRFRTANPDVTLRVEKIPQGSYQQAVTSAALTNSLPCVLDLDQPTVPNFAAAGFIQAIEPWVQSSTIDAMIPGAVTRYQNQIMALGQFEVALAVFSRKSELTELGIRVASLGAPYSPSEFMDVLETAATRYPQPIDLNASWAGEWSTYAYHPWLISGGADLVDPSHKNISDGFLNSDAALTVLDYLYTLFHSGYVNLQPLDDRAFITGDALFHYTGSWAAQEYAAKLGEDLVLMPPVDFGHGPKIGSGSWQWAISSSCEQPELAASLIEHLVSKDEIASFSEATGLIPTRSDSAELTTLYRTNGQFRPLFDYSEQLSVKRPETPQYPVISNSFSKLVEDIKDQVDPVIAADIAVENIDTAFERLQ